MGLQIRDDRQRKALTGLSQDPLNRLLPVFRDLYQATQQKTDEAGRTAGTRRRKPGGGSKGKRPTMAEQFPFVLSYDKTYPPLDGLAMQLGMARAKANANRHKLSPMLSDTLVPRARRPYREWATPEEVQAALHGVDRLRIEATERAYHRSADDAKQRAHDRGKKNSIRGKIRSWRSQTS